MSEEYYGKYDGIQIMIDPAVTPGKIRLFCLGETEVRTYRTEEEFKESDIYKKWEKENQEFKAELGLMIRKMALGLRKERAEKEKLKPVCTPRYDAVYDHGVWWLEKENL